MNPQLQTKLIFGLIGLGFLGFIGLKSVSVVDEGQKGVVLTFGEISTTWEPGLHFKLPLIQTLTKYSTRIQKTTFGRVEENKNDHSPILSAYSNDQQIIRSYRVSITWSYDANKIDQVYKMFGTESDYSAIFYTVVSPTLQQTSKTLFGQYTAQTIIQKRAELNSKLDQLIKEQLTSYPLNIISVQIEDVNFSNSYEAVIEQTAQKKQEVEKAKNELQRIEIEAQQEVSKAEAHNKAVKLQADAKAYQIKVQAEAEAEAIRLKSEALRANKELINLTIAERWNGTVPSTVVVSGKDGGNNVVPLLNLDTK